MKTGARPHGVLIAAVSVVARCALTLWPAVAVACAAEITLADQTGRAIRLPVPAKRVVSLAPNMTEMLYAVGGEAAGDTTFCDYPAEARAVPKVGGMDPDYEAIARAHPDLILATTAGNRMEAVEYLRSLGYSTYTSDPRNVEAILAAMLDIGTLTDHRQEAAEAVSAIRKNLDAVATRRRSTRQPRVLCLIWPDPIMTVGSDTFVHELIERAGGKSVTASFPHGWPVLDRESFLVLEPDLILMAVAPDRMTMEKLPRSLLDLVGDTRVVFIDEDLLLRPGPRIGDAVIRLESLFTGSAR